MNHIDFSALRFPAVTFPSTVMESFWSLYEDLFQEECDLTTSEVLWQVHNFSHSNVAEGQKIESPVFKLGLDLDCFFELYPKGEGKGTLLDVRLKNCNRRKPEVLFFSIPSAKYVGMDTAWEVNKKEEDDKTTASLSVKDCEQTNQNADLLTTGDTLTIRCVMKHPVRGHFQPKHILLRSSFNVKHFCSTVQINSLEEKFRRDRVKHLPDMEVSGNVFKTCLVLSANAESIQVHITPEKTIEKNVCATCKLSVLDSDGIPLGVFQESHLFTESAKWKISHQLNTSFFLSSKESYVLKDCLDFIIELTYTDELCTEEIRYGHKTLVSVKVRKDSSFVHGSLKSDLQSLMGDDSCYDVHLKIGSESVPVHKSILRARSSVFKAMMDHDTVENATSTVTMSDMDIETLHHMVRFMYTDTVKDLDWKNALHLYYAADKYDISLLKKLCAEHLVKNLSQSNVYDVIVLSDMHDDVFLKKYLRKFIFSQKSTLVKSEEWKAIEQNFPNLALEILRELYCKAVVPKEEEDSDSKKEAASSKPERSVERSFWANYRR